MFKQSPLDWVRNLPEMENLPDSMPRLEHLTL